MANLSPYNLPQSVFMVSLGSNALFGKIDTQANLQSMLQAFLGPPQAGQRSFFFTLNKPSPTYPCLALASAASSGDWATVWGPVVYQAADNPGATNAMYVAHSKTLNVYVVGIAGTNPDGDTALFVEDLDVQPANMVAWPPFLDMTATPPSLTFGMSNPKGPDPSKAYIAAGTADGINVLYTMQDPSSGKTLSAFLGGVSQAGQTLIFTGHSLGGALSPTMAMLLYPQARATQPSGGNPAALASNWTNVYILATAGPTPGTPGFAQLFATAYAPVATGLSGLFTQWNVIYANAYDVVPRAWNALSGLVTQPARPLIDKFPSFFAGGTPLAPLDGGDAGPMTYGLVNDMMTKAGYGGGGSTPYYVPCLQHVPFTGIWGDYQKHATTYPPPWSAPSQSPPLAVIADVDGLVTWVLNAHLGQYSHALLGFAGPSLDDALTVPPG